MSTQRPLKFRGQKGVSLVIALILLLVLTIIGIASMNTSLMQERMAGNVNLQTLAFEAASAGIVDALDFLDTSYQKCRRGEEPWDPNPTEWEQFRQLGGLGPDELPAGIRVGYQLRAGCFPPDDEVLEWADWDEDIPHQLLVLSRGVVCRGATCTGANLADDSVLAVREVEVRVSPVGGGDPACLLNVGPISGAAKAIGVGKSAAYLVDGGEDGCPVKFANSSDANRFTSALGGDGSSLVGQYQPRPPGISSAEPGSRGLWETPAELARAVNAIKIGVRAYSVWEQDDSLPGANPFAECAGQFQPNSSFPGPITGSPGVITYVAGELDTAGMSKGTIRDSIVFVEGPLDISGTTPYQGADFVALGGSFNASGWGKAQNSGLIYLEKLADRNAEDPSKRISYDPPNARMDDVDLFNVSGFGKARITADDCDDLQNRWRQLNLCIDQLRTRVTECGAGCGDAELGSDFEFYIAEMGFDVSKRSEGGADDFDLPDLEENTVAFDIPNCGGPAGGFGTRNVIASWREYIDRARW